MEPHTGSQLNNTVQEREKRFFESELFDKQKVAELRADWRAYFADKTDEETYREYGKDWKLYVYATWELLYPLDEEAVLDAVEKQIPAAVSLEIDVYEKLMEYLYTRVIVESDVQSLFQKMKDRFINSTFIMGYENNKPVPIKEIVAELKKMSGTQINTLERAELYSRIQLLLFPDDKPLSPYVEVDSTDVVQNFVSLVHFFLGVPAERVWYVADRVVNSDRYDALEENLAKHGAETIWDLPHEPSEAELAAQIPLLTRIKLTIDNGFAKDEQGQFVKEAEVLALLDTLAMDYKDERIRDLYLFDEASGTFHWNEALLETPAAS